MEPRRVAVVGIGKTGLAMALRLQDRGFAALDDASLFELLRRGDGGV